MKIFILFLTNLYIYIYIYIYIKKNKSIKQLLMVTRGLGVLLSFSLEKPRQVDN
jgi:hypothetical protein